MNEQVPSDKSEFREGISPASLEWEDMLFLSGQQWGLRHVSSATQAEREIIEGVANGDAVSLSGIQTFLPQRIVEEDPRIIKMGDDVLPFRLLRLDLTQEVKDQMIRVYEHAVQTFCTVNTSQEDSMNTGFLIGNFHGADFPYDYDMVGYLNLGKCGKQSVPPENMVAALTATQIIGNSASGIAEQTKGGLVRIADASSFFNKVVRVIKARGMPGNNLMAM